MYRIRHSVDKPQKQGNARWYRFSLVELYRMCHAWGVNVRWQGASKDDLIGRLDEAMERATVAELRNKCECLGIHRYQRDETRQGLLRRVQAAQWAQCEECEKCEETLTAGDDDALFVGAHINEIRRAMTSAGYPVKSTMSKVDLLDLLEGTDPATLAIGRSEEEVPSEDKPLSSLKINDVRRMLKQYGVRYGISDNMGSLMKYLEGVGVGEAEQGLGVPSVGQRVRVYWDDEQMWYGGTVKQVLEQYGLGYVEYDDGDEAWEAFGVGSRTTWAYGEGEEGERDEVTGDGDGNVPAAPVDNVESPERASDREVTTEAGAGVVRGELALSPLTALIDSKSLSDVYLDMVPSFGADVVGATSPALRFGQPLSPGDWVAGGDDHHQPPQDERPLPTHGECREIAIRVLRDAAMSMSPAEIVRTAIGRGWITLGNDLASTRIRGRFCSALNNIPRDLVGALVKPSVGKYGLAEWSAGRDVAEDDSSEPPPQLVPPSSPQLPQSPPRSLSSPAHRSSQGFVNRIRDYGDLPTWSKKAIRGASASLLVNTPTAIENAERADTAEYTEEFAGSDDNDLFGEERKWGMDLPDAHSGWEAPHTESGGQINGLLGNASSALSRSSMCPLDLDISPEEVIQRIDLVCDFLEDCVYDKHLPFIPLPSRDSRPAFNLESDANIARFSHMMIALDIIHENLVEYSDARITQRDLYYIAHSRDPSIKSTAFMQTIQDLSVLLNVPRFAMGIDCRSKGLVYGPIELPGGVSCMVPRGTPISGSVVDTLAIPRVNLQSVTCIIVAEKESVFQRLAKEAASHPIFSTCLIVTGCGYPDIGTRAFLHRLHMQDTNVRIEGIPPTLGSIYCNSLTLRARLSGPDRRHRRLEPPWRAHPLPVQVRLGQVTGVSGVLRPSGLAWHAQRDTGGPCPRVHGRPRCRVLYRLHVSGPVAGKEPSRQNGGVR